MKVGPIGYPETSVLNQHTLRNNPEEERIQVAGCTNSALLFELHVKQRISRVVEQKSAN
jgi:hypothetical protein